MFNDPEFTREMGGEYVSEWKVGSHLCWMGPEGVMFTDGRILKIVPCKLLQHTLFHPDSNEELMSTITYELTEQGGSTTVKILEQFADPISEDEYEDSLGAWEAALDAVKELLSKS